MTTPPEQPPMSVDDAARLAEIRARVEAATAGPWLRHGAVTRGGFTFGENEINTVNHVPVVAWTGFDDSNQGPVTQRRANAEFIAHAREDVPYLLDLLAAARAVPATAAPLEAEGELRAAAQGARDALHENITTWITLQPSLDTPYEDDPRWTPWTRFGKRAADAAANADAVLRAALAAPKKQDEVQP